jgi:hypothetical protein
MLSSRGDREMGDISGNERGNFPLSGGQEGEGQEGEGQEGQEGQEGISPLKGVKRESPP